MIFEWKLEGDREIKEAQRILDIKLSASAQNLLHPLLSGKWGSWAYTKIRWFKIKSLRLNMWKHVEDLWYVFHWFPLPFGVLDPTKLGSARKAHLLPSFWITGFSTVSWCLNTNDSTSTIKNCYKRYKRDKLTLTWTNCWMSLSKQKKESVILIHRHLIFFCGPSRNRALGSHFIQFDLGQIKRCSMTPTGKHNLLKFRLRTETTRIHTAMNSTICFGGAIQCFEMKEGCKCQKIVWV